MFKSGPPGSARGPGPGRWPFGCGGRVQSGRVRFRLRVPGTCPGCRGQRARV